MPRSLTPRAGRAAFTLPELLVAFTLLVVIASTLGTLLVSQLRLFNRTAGTTQMQRDLRTGISLLPMDLRGASREGGDLLALSDSSIELRATIGSSVVCTRVSNTQVDLPPLEAANKALTSWYATPQAGDIALFYDAGPQPGPEDDQWVATTVQSLAAAPSGSCAGAPFTDPTRDAGKTRWRLTVTGTNVPDSSRAGAPVRLLRRVRYSLYNPGTSPDNWYLGYREFSGGAWQNTEAIAGPFEAHGGTQSGIRFAYFDTLGQPLAAGFNPNRVGRIDLTLRARAFLRGGTADSVVLRDSVAVRVALRNRT